MQDLTGKSVEQCLDFSSAHHLHSMGEMTEQLPIGENTYPVEVTPECAQIRGSDCQIVGKKLYGARDHEQLSSNKVITIPYKCMIR